MAPLVLPPSPPSQAPSSRPSSVGRSSGAPSERVLQPRRSGLWPVADVQAPVGPPLAVPLRGKSPRPGGPSPGAVPSWQEAVQLAAEKHDYLPAAWAFMKHQSGSEEHEKKGLDVGKHWAKFYATSYGVGVKEEEFEQVLGGGARATGGGGGGGSGPSVRGSCGHSVVRSCCLGARSVFSGSLERTVHRAGRSGAVVCWGHRNVIRTPPHPPKSAQEGPFRWCALSPPPPPGSTGGRSIAPGTSPGGSPGAGEGSACPKRPLPRPPPPPLQAL